MEANFKPELRFDINIFLFETNIFYPSKIFCKNLFLQATGFKLLSPSPASVGSSSFGSQTFRGESQLFKSIFQKLDFFAVDLFQEKVGTGTLKVSFKQSASRWLETRGPQI